MKKMFRYLCCIVVAVAVMFCVVPISAEYISEFALNTSTKVNLNSADDYASFWFTAPESCVYKFYSTGDYDTMAYVVDSQNNFITYGDDCNDDLNFAVFVFLRAGSTYGFIADFIDEDATGSFNIELVKTNIKSVKINDVTVYEGIDSFDMPHFDEETGEIIGSYNYYFYFPSFTVTLKDGTVLQSDEYGSLTYDGQTHYCNYEDNQSYANEWKNGTYSVMGEVFGISQTFNVIVAPNSIKSVEFEDITLYDGWDCIVVDEEWSDILGMEITDPITIYFYTPVYTVTLNDGTVLQSDELGCVEYNGTLHIFNDLQDSQDIDNQWQVGGTYTSSATVFGITDTFNVTIETNPAKEVKFDDIVLLKDWDCYTDYDYNPETEEYDLEWQRYAYIPSYTITLNDGTVLESDENGYVYFNNKTYGALGFDDGQSYETPWTEGMYNVIVRVFGEKYSFNVTLEEMISVKGDFNRDSVKNNKDLGLLMQYLNGWDVKIDKGACDVNGDSAVNNKDYGLFMQFLNGWEVELK